MSANPSPPTVTQQNPSNQWDVLSGYAKTVITLASALLAITVTFSTELIGNANHSLQIILVVATWSFLVLAILLGVLGTAFIVNYLRKGEKEKLAILCSNGAFFSLLIAGILLLVFGTSQLVHTPDTIEIADVVENVMQVAPDLVTRPNANWIVNSVVLDSADSLYEVVLDETSAGSQFVLQVDAVSGEIRSIHNAP